MVMRHVYECDDPVGPCICPPPPPVINYEVIWPLVTLEQVLERLPSWLVADFDCPGRGPHCWLETGAHGVTWRFCRHCNRKTVIRSWQDMRVLQGIWA